MSVYEDMSEGIFFNVLAVIKIFTDNMTFLAQVQQRFLSNFNKILMFGTIAVNEIKSPTNSQFRTLLLFSKNPSNSKNGEFLFGGANLLYFFTPANFF